MKEKWLNSHQISRYNISVRGGFAFIFLQDVLILFLLYLSFCGDGGGGGGGGVWERG